MILANLKVEHKIDNMKSREKMHSRTVIQGVPEVKTIFVIILRCHLPIMVQKQWRVNQLSPEH